MPKKMEVKIIPAVISFILFLIFVSPVFMGILNVGNAFGAILSGFMTAVFVFYRQFKMLLSGLCGNIGGKIFLSVVSSLVLVFAVLAVIMSISMACAINNPPKDDSTTVIVLGCKVKNGRPSLMLKRRLERAYEYLSENKNANVIVSGGKGIDESISEAECMHDWLVAKGIPESRIFIEDKSTSTEENLDFSREIIHREKISENITLITDGFHQYRACLIAEKSGFDRESIYNLSGYTSWYIVPTYWVREWFGIAWFKVKN